MGKFLKNYMRKVEMCSFGEWIRESIKGSYLSYVKLKVYRTQSRVDSTDPANDIINRFGFLGDSRKSEEFYCRLWECERMVLWSYGFIFWNMDMIRIGPHRKSIILRIYDVILRKLSSSLLLLWMCALLVSLWTIFVTLSINVLN